MTDRELLELAAKAAGWTWWQSKHGYWNIKGPDCEERAACCGWFKFDSYTGSNLAEPTPADALLEVGFNPLDDDGDALQLAVELRLMIAWDRWNDNDYVCIRHRDLDEEIGIQIDQRPEQTVRRAIVRAAAEIGRAMG